MSTFSSSRKLRAIILKSLARRRNQSWALRGELLSDTGKTDQTLHPEVEYLLEKGYVKIPINGGIDQLQYVPYAHLKITAEGVDYLDELEKPASMTQGTVLSVKGRNNFFGDSIFSGNVDVPGKNNTFHNNVHNQGTATPERKENKWFWWVMSVIAGVIILYVGYKTGWNK